jgi:hypothetical protein
MKVTLDIDQLLSEEKITQAEYEKLRALAAVSTGSLAFNILIDSALVLSVGLRWPLSHHLQRPLSSDCLSLWLAWYYCAAVGSNGRFWPIFVSWLAP